MDKTIFSLIQMIASFLLVLLQLSTIPVFVVYPNLRNRILYRIMLSIALSDFLQLFAIFQFTFYEYFGWKASDFTQKFASGVYIIAWDHLIVQHFLLALNRLIIFVRAFYFPNNYKEESKSERWAFNFLLILSWLIMSALQVLFMTICGGIWDDEAVGFFYDNSPCSDKYRQLEFYFTIAFPAISICCYVAIIFILKKSRESTENIQQQQQPPKQQNNPSNKKIKKQNQKFNKQEKRILIISVLLFSIITALIFAWYLDYKHPPWTMLFLGYLLINTSLTLSMNSEYRGHFFHLWKKIYKFILFREVISNNVTDVRQQQQTAVIKLSTTAGTGAPLFLRRNEANNARNEQTKINNP
ncbi:unnamed protein product [Meloidogyne enterolobii]|uniref:Uncharacterized protein n=1 Tax=Meloidogyne enterolobii TaxID=390850 RepID=A0ACB0XWD3_MELEN